MKTYEVKCEGVNYGKQSAETMKEAIRFTRMECFAKGITIPDEGWYAVEIVNAR